MINKIKKEIKNIVLENKIYGNWIMINEDSAYSYAISIDEDTITVYVLDEEDMKIQWTGSFDGEEIIDKDDKNRVVIKSKAYKNISEGLSSAQKIEVKEFTYTNGAIIFGGTYNEDYSDIYVRKIKEFYLPTVKMQNDRESGFNEKTNLSIDLGNYIINYPDYFDEKDRDSFKQKVQQEESGKENEKQKNSFLPIYSFERKDVENGYTNDNFIVLNPSDTSAYAELFLGTYENVQVELDDFVKDSINVITDRNLLIDSKKTSNENADSIVYMFITSFVDENGKVSYGMAYETWFYIKEKKEVLEIGMAYTFDDKYKYDYITDYKKILENVVVK